MKKIILPISILAIIVAIYEQSKPNKNVYIMSVCILVFMFGMMRLSAKTPSKKDDNSDENNYDKTI